MTAPRDRDAAGRPRNARPRDATGRPLPRDGRGTPAIDESAVVAQRDALLLAQRALDDGQPFAAHEYLEVAWRRADPDERDFWQGLAQLAAGLTHAQRGNRTGARALLERGRDRLARYAGTRPYDVPVDDIRATAVGIAAAIEQPEAVAEVPQLRLV